MIVVKPIVSKIIKKYQTRDPYKLSSCLKIKIFYEELGHINGFYQSCPKNKIIHLNKNLESNFKKIVCAHELGHALIHSNLNILFLEKHTFFGKSQYEIEANTFAAELLIPDETIIDNPEYTIEQIAMLENVNIELVKLKVQYDISFPAKNIQKNFNFLR